MNIPNKDKIVHDISMLTREMAQVNNLKTFNQIIRTHEEIVSDALKYDQVKDIYFKEQ